MAHKQYDPSANGQQQGVADPAGQAGFAASFAAPQQQLAPQAPQQQQFMGAMAPGMMGVGMGGQHGAVAGMGAGATGLGIAGQQAAMPNMQTAMALAMAQVSFLAFRVWG
jgi:hypothetical protein